MALFGIPCTFLPPATQEHSRAPPFIVAQLIHKTRGFSDVWLLLLVWCHLVLRVRFTRNIDFRKFLIEKVKFGHSEKHTKFEKNLPLKVDVAQ